MKWTAAQRDCEGQKLTPPTLERTVPKNDPADKVTIRPKGSKGEPARTTRGAFEAVWKDRGHEIVDVVSYALDDEPESAPVAATTPQAGAR